MPTRIYFFGALGDKGGSGRVVEIPSHIDTLARLVDWIADDDHDLKAALLAPSVRIAVDRSIAHDMNESLASPEEIAFMPPFSGG